MMHLKRLLPLIAAGLLATPCLAADAPLLHPMFQDHGVLQRERPLPVWGLAQPGQTVTVTLGDNRIETVAGGDGHWRGTLPAQKPGTKPLRLTAQAGEQTQTVDDLLVGDVYLCSGQSNMEMPVKRALSSGIEMINARHPLIRYLNVDRASAVTPQTDFASRVSWQAVTPEMAGEMSAVCYFFGREMRQITDVPVGLIHSSWGGSAVEAWMDAPELATAPGRADEFAIVQHYAADRAAGLKGFGTRWQDWWRTRAKDQPWNDRPRKGDGWRAAPASFKPWESWGVPELADFNGLVWMRTSVSLTAEQAKQPATLLLGPVDDIDVTWVNGKVVGSLFAPADARRYPLPPGTLKAGENRVVVSILDGYGDGGLYGSAEAQALLLADGTRIPLQSPWAFKVVPGAAGTPPHAPWGTVDGLGTLRNAMIVPIGAYALRAVLWYQGEANVGAPAQYQGLLAGMMAGWRRQFGPDLPFLIVQLPEFGKPTGTPGPSGWAGVREAQRQTVAADAHAGLAVAMGVGDWTDIHPTNKQVVAKRLAHAARHVLLGQDVAPSGPVPTSVERQGDRVVIRFAGITDGLVAYGNIRPIGFELCGADQASCRFVDASLSGDSVTLSVGTGPATRVRYGWADSPICTLYDGSGLPAGPFEMAVN